MKLLPFSELRFSVVVGTSFFQLLSLRLIFFFLINQSCFRLLYAKEQNIIWDLMVLCPP